MSSCELCARDHRVTTRHHLIPRTCHGNKWFKKNFTRERIHQTVDLCRDCHRAIHRFVPDEKVLGRHHNTLRTIRAIPEMPAFLTWVKKQR